MTQEYKSLNNYMRFIANTLNYKTWSDDYQGKEFKDKISVAKELFKKENINFNNLTDEELKCLGFCDFDENSKNLIPLWLFRILDDNTKVISFNGNECLLRDADDDVRFGCTVYMLDI